MGRNGKVLFMLVAVAVAAAANAPSRAAVISAEGKQGRLITVRTGTASGDCRADGSKLVCTDGDRIAVADLQAGCTKSEGGAQCDAGPQPSVGSRPPEDDGPVVTPAESGIDVECSTGAKKGYIYTINDGDGQGSCSLTYDGIRVSGGSCTKGRNTCADVDCQHGCTGASLNCGCRIKTRPRDSVTAAD